jgi:CRP/FNR family transcriptional regulator, cyclic AMP receptor protein
MRGLERLSSRPVVLPGGAGTISRYHEKETIYSQGAAGRSIYYIHEGIVTLTVRSQWRRPAVVAVLGAGDFFNELCLLGHPRCTSTAVAITSCSIRAIEKEKMIRILRRENGIATFFLSCLLSSIVRFREDLVDVLVNSSEQRLARVLLRLAQAGRKGRPMARLPRISQQALAEMVGTTRPRANLFMNRFRKRGFIHYNSGLEVRSALRTVLQQGRGDRASHQSPRAKLSSASRG